LRIREVEPQRVHHVVPEDERAAHGRRLRPTVAVGQKRSLDRHDVVGLAQLWRATLERVDVAPEDRVVGVELIVHASDDLLVVVIEVHVVLHEATRVGGRGKPS
jgi:hypothetical protein